MLYLIIVIGFLALSYVYDYRGKEKDKLFWWIVMLVVLICVAGLRYQMGQDSIRYEKYYIQSPTLNNISFRTFEQSRFAPLYVMLQSACRSLTPDFILMQFVVAIIVNTTFFYFIWKHTKHVFLAGLLFFFYLYFTLNMQVLREALAASIFLLSWPFFIKKNWIMYYIMCVISFMFHISASVLFFLPLLVIPGIREFFRFGRRTLIIVPLLIALSFWLQYVLFDFIQLLSLTDSMSDRAATYAASDDLGKAKLNINGSAVLLFKSILYPLIALFFIRKDRSDSILGWKYEEVLCMVGIYLGAMAIGLPILYRFNDYFQIFLLVVVADCAYRSLKLRKKVLRLSFLMWIVLFVPLWVAQIHMAYFWDCNKAGTIKAYDMYWPYSNQFDKEIAPNRRRAINFMRNR